MRSTLRPSHATQAERDRTIPENLSPRAAATRAMWPCAVPIRPAYDTRARSESVSSSNQRRTRHAQRPTPKPEFRSRKVGSSRSARPLLYIHDVPSRWFVDGADDCACDCELDHSAGDPAAKDLKC